MTEKTTGVLIVNLGTPDSPRPLDVYKYLVEFLTDGRVIDIPWWKRQLLVRGIIGPLRCRQSAKAYKAIWTKEGSPLKVFSQRTARELQLRLGNSFHVELAMRYRSPSISNVLEQFRQKGFHQLIVIPLFPQYASATTGSVHQNVMEIVSKWDQIPKLNLIKDYATHPKLIHAFCKSAETFNLSHYDHILFSFHGLPERHIRQSDCKGTCLSKNCCESLTSQNQHCYSAQCYATARGIAENLHLKASQYTITFQSRLGKDPWLKPYTSEVIHSLANRGIKRLLVFCPAFTCDCLETIYEIGTEYAEEFKAAGGEHLDLVPSLNDSKAWIDALEEIILNK